VQSLRCRRRSTEIARSVSCVDREMSRPQQEVWELTALPPGFGEEQRTSVSTLVFTGVFDDASSGRAMMRVSAPVVMRCALPSVVHTMATSASPAEWPNVMLSGAMSSPCAALHTPSEHT
jgi:hypothetical protein